MSEEIKEIKNPLKEIVQPFIDLVNSPRALWGINLPYLFEGMCYFGILGYLAIYFSDIVFKGVPHNDVWSHWMVMVLTAGITISMFFLGFVADKFGIRRALLAAFCLLLAGRVLISAGSFLGLSPGLWGGLHLITLVGMLFVVIGYGMYQPAAYAGVREVTNEKTAPMAFAMLYALMNLGGYLPTFAFFVRDKDYLGWGIPGAFWVYTFFTFIALGASFLILSNKTYKEAVEKARAEKGMAPLSEEKPKKKKTFVEWVRHHPLTDLKFAFFIFALIPVQTLFTYNWLILPQYINRCYEGWIGEKFEIMSNFNPILIFILVPIITAITYKRKVYNMMILGTFIMASPAFLLSLDTSFTMLFSYLVIMTIGEAMWQPRFLQFAAQIAPEGRTGEYMGVAQLPWFLTKVLVPAIYSGYMIEKFCPVEGAKNPQTMWMWFGFIAIASPILLLIAKPWAGKDFKAKAE